jgi:hypothetical protein
VGQEKALLFFVPLGHIDLGCLIPPLLTALTGPVALFATAATDVIAARNTFAVTSRALFAATFAFATGLPAIVVAIGHAVVRA